MRYGEWIARREALPHPDLTDSVLSGSASCFRPGLFGRSLAAQGGVGLPEALFLPAVTRATALAAARIPAQDGQGHRPQEEPDIQAEAASPDIEQVVMQLFTRGAVVVAVDLRHSSQAGSHPMPFRVVLDLVKVP